jgi:hypothetical protein
MQTGDSREVSPSLSLWPVIAASITGLFIDTVLGAKQGIAVSHRARGLRRVR